MKYLVYGDDSYRALSFIRSISPTKPTIIDNPNEIEPSLGNLAQRNLFGKEDVFVYRNLLKPITLHIDQLKTATKPVIIWEETSSVKTKKEIKQIFELKEFQPLKRYEVIDWIIKSSQNLSLNIEKPAINKLYELHESNLFMLHNELNKLSGYAKSKGNRPITTMDVGKLCQDSIQANIFEFLDSFANKNKSKLLQTTRTVFNKSDDDWIVFHMLTKHLRQIYWTKLKMKLKAHPFVIKKLTQQEKNWQLNELKSELGKLLEIETRVKSGKTEIRPELLAWILSH